MYFSWEWNHILQSRSEACFMKAFCSQFIFDGVFTLQIATKFCTCYDSTAVVLCEKFGSDHFVRIEARSKQNCHRIWITMEKPYMKWASVCDLRICWRTSPSHDDSRESKTNSLKQIYNFIASSQFIFRNHQCVAKRYDSVFSCLLHAVHFLKK